MLVPIWVSLLRYTDYMIQGGGEVWGKIPGCPNQPRDADGSWRKPQDRERDNEKQWRESERRLSLTAQFVWSQSQLLGGWRAREYKQSGLENTLVQLSKVDWKGDWLWGIAASQILTPQYSQKTYKVSARQHRSWSIVEMRTCSLTPGTSQYTSNDYWPVIQRNGTF